MRRLLVIYTVLWLLLITSSCKKKSSSAGADCLTGLATVRTITNGEAMVKQLGGTFYIIEKNTIDTQLLPCNLSDEFKIDKLNVRITGEVKSRDSAGPCCMENFLILKISK